MEDKFYKELVDRYLQRKLDEEELQVFFHLLHEGKLEKYLSESMDNDLYDSSVDVEPSISKHRYIKYVYRVAAVLALAVIATSAYFYIYKSQTDSGIKQQEVFVTVVPGGNKAYLTLADGKKINLTEVENGMLVEQAGIKIVKKSNGELIYEVVGENSTRRSNTIETPVGGQYQIVLPDGTKVWLNANSILEYPLDFSGNERKVTLNGEGYFEVKSDKSRPFRVISGNQTIEVLGTKFNVNTYRDELSMKTTLLEGSVRVSVKGVDKLLKPGEQARVIDNSIEVSKADIDQAIAWHRGDIAFEGIELRSIMRQISRWYDVDVVYRGGIEDVKFSGSISRSKSIQEVLKVLSMTKGVNFKLEGRRVLVMP